MIGPRPRKFSKFGSLFFEKLGLIGKTDRENLLNRQ